MKQRIEKVITALRSEDAFTVIFGYGYWATAWYYRQFQE